MARRQIGQLDAPAGEEGVGADEEGVGPLAHKVAKAASISRLVLALRTWICSPMARAAASTSLNVVSVLRSIGRIDEHGNTSCSGHQLTQEFQPLCHQLTTEKIDARQVAARPGEAGDKTKPDRVFADDEDDGDRRGCRLGRECRRRGSERGDHGDLPANQFGRQRRQPIDLTFGPAVFDRHVLALDIAGLLQALAECAQTVAQLVSGDVGLRNPITGIAGCCARAALEFSATAVRYDARSASDGSPD